MVVVWLVTTTTLVVATLTIGVESASGNDIASGLPPRPEPAGPPVAAPAHPTDLYPSVRYAGLTWSMVSSRTIDRSEGELLGEVIVVSEVIVSNSTAGTDLRVRESDVALRWSDGRLDPIERFEQLGSARRLVLRPGERASLTVVVKPRVATPPELDELALEIGERGRVPVLLPLDGSPPETSFPIEAGISNNPVLLPDPDATDRSDVSDGASRWLVVAPKAVRFEAEYGLYRAAISERFALVTLSVQRSVRTPESPHLKPDFWALDVDGVPVPPIRISRTEAEEANEDDVELVFKVALGAERMTLMAGVDTEEPTGYPVMLEEPLG